MKHVFTFLILFSVFIIQAQPKTGAKVVSKTAAKGNIAADIDCIVKVNGAAKTYTVKGFEPQEVPLKVGDNAIEATTLDKSTTIKRKVYAKTGETVLIELTFLEDGKIFDYIKKGSLSMVETAIKKDPTLINNDNQLLTSQPLEIAIINSQVEIAKLLLSKGASFTRPDNMFPLHKAILYASSAKPAKDKLAPDRELINLFLTRGCRITDKDDGGNTPLHCAVRAGKIDLVTYFVEKGANVNAKNDFDDTPLKIAQDKGLITIITYLKSKGATDK